MPATTIRLDDEVYEQLRLYVYSRKMLEPGISMSQVINQALRDLFARRDGGPARTAPGRCDGPGCDHVSHQRDGGGQDGGRP